MAHVSVFTHRLTHHTRVLNAINHNTPADHHSIVHTQGIHGPCAIVPRNVSASTSPQMINTVGQDRHRTMDPAAIHCNCLVCIP